MKCSSESRAWASACINTASKKRKRKQVEQAFGWMKTIALLRKLRHRGGARVEWIFTFTAAAYNLVRRRPLVMEANT